jgi:NitT/TauT family transport system substrate-binding protein
MKILKFFLKIVGLFILFFLLFSSFYWFNKNAELSSERLHLKTPPMTWRIPIDVWGGNFWIVVADQKGFFKEAGLQTELVDVSDDYVASIDALTEGKLSFNLISAFDLVNQNTKGADLVGILVADESEGAEALVAQPSYTQVSDLKGRRIGVEAGSYMDYYLNLILGYSKMTYADIVKVDAQTEDLSDLFFAGDLDAMMTWEPRISEAVEKGARFLFGTSNLPGVSQNILVLKRSLIQDHHDQVTALVQVWKKTTEWMEQNPEEMLTLLSQVTFKDIQGTYSKEDLRDLLKTDLISTYNQNEAAFLFTSSVQSLYSQLSSVSRFLQRQGLLKTLPDINVMLEPHFIRELSLL